MFCILNNEDGIALSLVYSQSSLPDIVSNGKPRHARRKKVVQAASDNTCVILFVTLLLFYFNLSAPPIYAFSSFFTNFRQASQPQTSEPPANKDDTSEATTLSEKKTIRVLKKRTRVDEKGYLGEVDFLC